MNNHNEELEIIATDLLEQAGEEPYYSNRDFMNTIIIFQTALMDKMWGNQNFDGMDMKDRENMATRCGMDLRKLIFTYTGLDTHKIEEFL